MYWSSVSAIVLVMHLVVAGIATASAEVSGPVRVRVEDAHGSNCPSLLSRACLFEVSSDGTAGGTTVDASQRYSRVLIGVDLDPSPAPLPAGVTPVVEKRAEGDEMALGWTQIYAQLVSTYNSIPQERPRRDMAGPRFDADAVGIYAYGPAPIAPTGPHANRTWGFEMNDSRGGVSSSSLGPFNENLTMDSDEWIVGFTNLSCTVASFVCDGSERTLTSTLAASTPNVKAGLEWESVAVTSDPAAWANATHGESVGAVRIGRSSLAEPSAPVNDTPRAPPSGSIATPGGTASPTTPRPDQWFPPRPRADAGDAEPPVGRDPRGSVRPLGALAAAGALVAVLAAGFYSRFTSNAKVLEHPARAAILAAVESFPGISSGDLRRRLGLGRTLLAYHIRLLQRAGLIRSTRVHGKLRFSPMARSAAAPPLLADALAHPTRAPFLEALTANPQGLTRAQLHAAAPQIPLRTRNYAISRLEAMGLIRRTSDSVYRLAMGATTS